MEITHSFVERLENQCSMAPIRPICFLSQRKCAYNFELPVSNKINTDRLRLEMVTK